MIVLGFNGFSKGAGLFARHYRATGIDRHMLFGHDSGAALVVDGRVVAAVEEERLNREKKTSAFPLNAVRWVLEEGGVSLGDVDAFAFSWRFSDEVLGAMISEISDGEGTAEQKFGRLKRLTEIYDGMFSRAAVLGDFEEHTGFRIDGERLHTVPHHVSHLMCGYGISGGTDAAFLVSDGRAEWLSCIMGEVRGGKVRVFDDASIDSRHSLAMLFGVITRYLGFTPNNDEYKVMGLAGYEPPAGAPGGNPFLEHVLSLKPGGVYEIPYHPRAVRAYYELFDRVFGVGPEGREDFGFRVRVARAAQEMVEVATAHQVAELRQRSNLDRLVFEGGLALNCVNNTKLLEGSGYAEVEVSYGASDPGVAVGAALHVAHEAGDELVPPVSPYLGPEFDDAAIVEVLGRYGDRVRVRELEDVVGETARLLQEEVVVGWYQGRTEYGPRALGNRSILANPSFDGIKDTINTRIKHREPFRPFAPIVLEDVAPDVFVMGKKRTSPYMTFVFPVRPEHVDGIPGATHVDGTSRIQTVTAEGNPLMAALLGEFTRLTGVPCLINTSFNVAGEPIVSAPEDAVECFLKTEMDYLVLGRHLVTKV